jgi:hypothetical protein
MAVENLWHNEGAYALAIQYGNYRAAAREAVNALRRIRKTTGEGTYESRRWELLLWGALKYRHPHQTRPKPRGTKR